MFITFAFVEFALEGLVLLLFEVSEGDLLARTLDVELTGTRYHLVTFALFFVESLVIMWTYGLVRGRIASPPRAAAATSAIALFLVFVPFLNFTNMGVFQPESLALSLGFNLVELPTAVLVGAGVYEGWRISSRPTLPDEP